MREKKEREKWREKWREETEKVENTHPLNTASFTASAKCLMMSAYSAVPYTRLRNWGKDATFGFEESVRRTHSHVCWRIMNAGVPGCGRGSVG